MNYRGSARRLFGNSMAAIIGAIEIYNKPQFAYRDEVFVVLLINAWELLLKAIVSKSGGRIYYPKRPGEPYRTLSCRDAFHKAAGSANWPKQIAVKSVDANLELLIAYRDNVIHFYNNKDFSVLVYSLAQTSIINYRDVASAVFGKDLAEEITWRILPLGARDPVDPIEFMKKRSNESNTSVAVQEFLALLKGKTEELEASSTDTGRLLTVFSVSLESIKKISNADVVAGVTADDSADALIIKRTIDPNLSHPYRQKDILPKLKLSINSYTFQAIVKRHNLKGNRQYWWADDNGTLVKWSPETVRFINSLTPEEVDLARQWYTENTRNRHSER